MKSKNDKFRLKYKGSSKYVDYLVFCLGPTVSTSMLAFSHSMDDSLSKYLRRGSSQRSKLSANYRHILTFRQP
jgi:hypothetical protein